MARRAWFGLAAGLSMSGVTVAAELRLLETAPGVQQWVDTAAPLSLKHGHQRPGQCAGFFDLTDLPKSRRPRPVQESPWLASDPDPAHADVVEPLLAELDAVRFRATVEKLASYKNRYYTMAEGRNAALWIKREFQRLAQRRPEVQVSEFRHRNWPQPSIIARIPGWDEALQESVVIGAHEDSINREAGTWARPRAPAPGADDNASGVAAVLEVFRVLMDSNYRPARDVYFITYAAEEAGLLGSHEIASHFWETGKQVMGVLNLDMILYAGPEQTMGVTTSTSSPRLNLFTKKLLDRYVGVPWAERDCGFACSDHASWDRTGFPASYVFEAVEKINPGWHTAQDDLSQDVDFDWGMNFVRLAAAFVGELSAPIKY